MAGGWRRHPLPFRIFSLGSRLLVTRGFLRARTGEKKTDSHILTSLSAAKDFKLKVMSCRRFSFYGAGEKRNTG